MSLNNQQKQRQESIQPGQVTDHNVPYDKNEPTRTKSIMKVSGTSGAVVSNTPEAGLKRAPKVMFSNSDTAASNSSGGVVVADTANGDRKQLQQGNDSRYSHKELNEGSFATLTSKLEGTYTKDSASFSEGNSTPKSMLTGGGTNGNTNEHAHFVVQDSLHSPPHNMHTGNSSIATSPRGSIVSSMMTSIKHKEHEIMATEASIHRNSIKDTGNDTLIPKISTAIEKDKLPLKKEIKTNMTTFFQDQDDGKLHVLLGCTGPIHIPKIKLFIRKLEDIYSKDKISFQIILTRTSTMFFNKRKIPKKTVANISTDSQLQPQTSDMVPPDFPSNVKIWKHNDEWNSWTQKSDPVFHIELKRWADILVIAPLTANTLAKMVLGLCDNLLTNVIRAWNPAFPIFIAPSMVSSTYNSITTKKQLKMIKEDMPWVTIFQPSEKIMSMHGNIGLGGMMDINEIIDKVVMKLGGYPKNEEEESDDNNDDEDDGSDHPGSKQNGKEDDRNISDGEDDDDEDDEDDEDDVDVQVSITPHQ